MGKEALNLVCDSIVKLKAKRLNINISNLTENVLKAIIAKYEGKSDIDIIELIEKKERNEKKIQELLNENYEIEALLFDNQEKEKETEKAKRKTAEKIVDSIRASGVLGDME